MTKEIMEIIEECTFYNDGDSCNECAISEWGFCSWKERVENPTLPNVPTCHYEKFQISKIKINKLTEALEIATDFIKLCLEQGTVGDYANDILQDIKEAIQEDVNNER